MLVNFDLLRTLLLFKYISYKIISNHFFNAVQSMDKDLFDGLNNMRDT